LVRIIAIEVPNDYKNSLKSKLAAKEIKMRDFIMQAIDEKIIRDEL